MANITFTVGQNIVPFTGTTDLMLSNLPNYDATHVNYVQAVSANGAGFSSGRPSSSLGITTLKAVPAGTKYNAYIFSVKQAFTADAALFGLVTGSAPGTDDLVCPVPTNAGATSFSFSTGSRLVLSAPVYAPASPAPAYTVQIGNGAPGTVAQFNAAVAALTDAQVAANGIQFTINITPSTTAAVSASFTASY